jgi:hypothetical protein
VKGHVDEMVSAGIQAEQFDVQHVGQPRHWVPVSRVSCRECPADARPREPRTDLWVLVDVGRVVDFDEGEVANGKVHGDRHHG